MKTWKQISAMAKKHDFVFLADEHDVSIVDSGALCIGRIQWWYGNRRKADRIMRAMIEAALMEMGR